MSDSAKPEAPVPAKHVGEPQPLNDGSGPHDEGESRKEKKPNVFKRIWSALGLDLPTLLIMAKGAMPPAIAIAAYESHTWAIKYSTTGYLVAIMSILGFCIMPRAKFIQTMVFNILGVCFGGAIAMLEVYSVVKAREHTTPHRHQSANAPASSQAASQTPQISYNSSASAVAAIWLIFTIWLANLLRAKRPQLQFPVIIYSIFTIVASTNCQRFPNLTVGKAFVKRLIETFLTGFGIAAAVSLFVFPTTSRTIVSKQIAGFLGLAEVTLGTHGAYLHSVSERHGQPTEDNSNGETMPKEGHKRFGQVHSEMKKAASSLPPEALAVRAVLTQLADLFGKIHIELEFAKREFAYGKLGPDELDQIHELLRDILLPVEGVATFVNILESVRQAQAASKEFVDSEETYEAIKAVQVEEWDELVKLSRPEYKKLMDGMHGGLQHSLFTLELAKKPKEPKGDIETKGESVNPGDREFAATLEKEIKAFHVHRVGTLKAWCERKGISLPSTFWDDSREKVSLRDERFPADVRHRENHQQLYLVLYLEYLTWSTARAILALVHFADSKVEDGTMKKKRWIFPGLQRLKRWVIDSTKLDDANADNALDDTEIGGSNVYLGDALNVKKDPEHLPPTNVWEKFGNAVRIIPAILRSPESAFGLRATLATMSVGILAYLERTQIFFIKQRLTWGMIMIAIGMSVHAGQGVVGFLGRIAGTTVAMCTSLILWYMGDRRTGAVIPLLYLFTFLSFYVIVKQPKFIIVAVLAIVTQTLIIGYELEVRVLGVKAATSNGQPAYPIYELAPYRLACVAAGLGVAFIWTYIPYPITTHSTMRKDLGAALYLLANYYSCVHTTIEMRLRLGEADDESTPGSPGYQLSKARSKVFTKIIVMLQKLQESSGFIKFDLSLGGKFPKETYDQAIESMQNIFNYMSLMSYATRTFSTDAVANESEWLDDFRKFANSATITSHSMTSMLCLMSASLSNSQPLPPYLRAPRPYNLKDDLEAVDPKLLSVQHIHEPCYAAFAVLQVASSLVTLEMERLVRLMKSLVGEVDFSFHVISTNEEGANAASSSTIFTQSSDLNKGKMD